MGVLFDYFTAPSDDVAAATIDLAGGPGTELHVLPAKGIDPVVKLATLEALLTGVDAMASIRRERPNEPVAIRDAGERLVLSVTDELQAALTDASDARLDEVAVPWSQTEEFHGEPDPESLASFLHELAGLARTASTAGQRMYCWVCV
jgi:hypothetical protein